MFLFNQNFIQKDSPAKIDDALRFFVFQLLGYALAILSYPFMIRVLFFVTGYPSYVQRLTVWDYALSIGWGVLKTSFTGALLALISGAFYWILIQRASRSMSAKLSCGLYCFLVFPGVFTEDYFKFYMKTDSIEAYINFMIDGNFVMGADLALSAAVLAIGSVVFANLHEINRQM